MKIPKLSSPLAKGIRTTEGILTTIIGGLIIIVSGIDPHTLPRKEGAFITAGLAALFTAQRGLIKIVALQKGFGVAAPIDNAKLDQTVAAITDHAAALDQVATTLSGLDLSKLPTKDQLEKLGAQLEAVAAIPPAGPSSPPQPSAPSGTDSADPAMDTASQLSDKSEQEVQPSDEDLAADNPVPPQLADGSAATPDAPVGSGQTEGQQA